MQFYVLLDVSISEVLGFFYKEDVMIDKKVVKLAIMKADRRNFISSDCAIDTIVRIDEPEEKLYTCSNCIYKDTIACLPKIRTLIDYESVLV